MRLVEVNVDDSRLMGFSNLTDVSVRSAIEVDTQRFILEGLLVLERAVSVGIVPVNVLVSHRMAPRVAELLADVDVDVLTASDDVLENTTGYHVHRGVLAEAVRPSLPDVATITHNARLILMLEALRDHANVGAAFRNAAALGVDAVLVSGDCADPLYRRSVKTSMGAVLQVPWTRVSGWHECIAELQRSGVEVIALTPSADAVDLRAAASRPARRALLIGTEGEGLQPATIALADLRVRIPMAVGPDSLNAAAATAVALYAFGPSSASSGSLA
jgi:tRNA G18 (ribose-2'-O)-methylase SpoU